MKRRILARIGALPPLPETVMRLQDVCRDPEAGAAAVAGVLEADPMLTANVLKVANSPFYGFCGEISSVRHATSLLGVSMVRGFVVAAALRRALPLDMAPYGLSNAAFTEVSTLQRALVFRWFSREDPEELKVLTPASFVMEMGKVVIADEVRFLRQERDFLRDLAVADDIEAVEKAYVGMDGREVCARMFGGWNFEAELVEAIGAMSDPEAAPPRARRRALSLAAVAACVSVTGAFDEERIDRARRLVADADRDPVLFAEAVAVLQDSREEVMA